MKVAIYARVSLGEKKGQSLEWQIETIKDSLPKDAQVVEIFQDRETGSSLLRPEFRRMLLCAANKDFETIAVFKLDRFARLHPTDSMYLMSRLKKMGLNVISALEPWFDITKIDEPLTVLHIFIVFWKSWTERIDTSQRTKASSLKQNKGGRPKGKKDSTPRARRWKARPDVDVSSLFS